MFFPQQKILGATLVLSLLGPGPVWSQTAPASGSPAGPVVRPGVQPPEGVINPQTGKPLQSAPKIKIFVIEGRQQVNRLSDGIFAMPVVEIRDANDRPIEGAQVTFILPGGSGAGARFSDGTLEKSFLTNFQGQAAAEGYVPNAAEGNFAVRVKASFQGNSTEISIPQASSYQTRAEAERLQSRRWRKWLWISGAAVGGGLTAYFLTRGSSTASGPVPVIVVPGGPVIGGR